MAVRWYEATIYERVEVGRDETRNPVSRLWETERTILVRTAPMSATHDGTEGNQFDMLERTFLTKAAPDMLRGAEAIEVGGELYEIEGTALRDAMIALRVRRCKHGIQAD